MGTWGPDWGHGEVGMVEEGRRDWRVTGVQKDSGKGGGHQFRLAGI